MNRENTTAHFWVQCWGCNKSVCRPYDDPADVDLQLLDLMKQGWRRREFGPHASPWFCGEACATRSYNAKQAEEWWARKQTPETDHIGNITGGIFILILVIIALFWK